MMSNNQVNNNQANNNQATCTLYIENREECDYKKKSSVPKWDIYGKGTGNYLLIPDDNDKLKDVYESIKNKIDKIGKELQARKLAVSINYGTTNKFVKNNIAEAKDIFNYICVTINKDGKERYYDLMGMRFCKDEKDNIQCILQSLQFARRFGNVKSHTIYPKTLNTGDIGGNKESDFYYNPTVSFFDDDETIIKSFLKFVSEY